MASPSLVRGLYKKMLLLSRSIPDAAKRADAVASIRDGFRANARETDADAVAALLRGAEKHVSFMKIVGRRNPNGPVASRGISASPAQKGKVSYVRDKATGKWVPGSASGPNATTVGGGHWGSVTSEHVRRAAALNQRQHFGGRK